MLEDQTPAMCYSTGTNQSFPASVSQVRSKRRANDFTAMLKAKPAKLAKRLKQMKLTAYWSYYMRRKTLK